VALTIYLFTDFFREIENHFSSTDIAYAIAFSSVLCIFVYTTLETKGRIKKILKSFLIICAILFGFVTFFLCLFELAYALFCWPEVMKWVLISFISITLLILLFSKINEYHYAGTGTSISDDDGPIDKR
jgi:glucan phosphoethanolaminetransferase (alkaline phosphatase superfamily)